MRKFKKKIIRAIKNRETFETRLVRIILGVNPNSVIIDIGNYFEIIITDNQVSISEEIPITPNWVLNKKVIDKVNTILSIYDLPQLTHKYFQWYLGDEKWKGCRKFNIVRRY